MAELSTYMEDRIVNFMRNVAITGQAAVYVGLWTNDDGLEANTQTSEVSGGSYARELAGLSASSDGTSSNAGDITFTTATASWGTITTVALLDASTGGNVIMYSALDASKTVASGDTFKMNTGDLDVTIV
ncbi:MAG: hypothetical protein IIB38_09595 [Candidatus Hydrogenedentes bacterium]|nr:hypothetical protein [Candidatus Hydrogenedentota bacterium]